MLVLRMTTGIGDMQWRSLEVELDGVLHDQSFEGCTARNRILEFRLYWSLRYRYCLLSNMFLSNPDAFWRSDSASGVSYLIDPT